MLPLEDITLRVTFKVVPEARDIGDLIQEKYSANNEILTSDLNQSPRFLDNAENTHFCQYIMMDGMEDARMIQLYGKALKGVNLLVICPTQPDYHKQTRAFLKKMMESLSVIQ